MLTLITLVQGAVTLVGFITLALVGLRAMTKDNPGLSGVLQTAQGLLIKFAGVALVAYVMLITYLQSGGTLSIETIGLYVACVGILVSLLKEVNIKGGIAGDLQTVVAHRAKNLQSTLAAQAEQARKAEGSESKRSGS